MLMLLEKCERIDANRLLVGSWNFSSMVLCRVMSCFFVAFFFLVD